MTRAARVVVALGAACIFVASGCRKQSFTPAEGGVDANAVRVAPVGSAPWTLSPPRPPTELSARPLAPEDLESTKLVAYSPDARYFASTSGDSVIVWDHTTRAREALLPGGERSIEALLWSADSALLALVMSDEVRVFDVGATKGRELVAGYKVATTGNHESIRGSRWAADRHELAIATSDGGLAFLTIAGNADDPASGVRVARRVGVATAALGKGLVDVSWSRDLSRAVVVTSMDYAHHIIDTGTGATVRTLAAPALLPLTVSFDPTEKRLLVVYNGGKSGEGADVHLFDVASGAAIKKLITGETRLEDAAWSPDGAQIAAAGFSGTVRLFDVAAGRLIASLGPEANSVDDVAWSPDGKELAAGGRATTLWNVEKRAVVQRWHRPLVPDRVACSADGGLVATHTRGFGVAVLERDVGQFRAPAEAMRRIEEQPARALTIATAPDSVRRVHVVMPDGVIRRWDATTLTAAPNVIAADYVGLEIEDLVASRDGRFVAALPAKVKKKDAGAPLSNEGLVVWSLETGAVVARAAGPLTVDFASRPVWSPRGDVIAVTSTSGDIAIVDATSGARVRDLKVPSAKPDPHQKMVLGTPSVKAAFTADGASLMTTSFGPLPDGGVRGPRDHDGVDLWSVATGEKTRHLRNVPLWDTTHVMAGGRWLAAGGSIVDLKTSAEVVDVNRSTAANLDAGPYTRPPTWAHSLTEACSPADGAWAAFPSADGVVIVRPSGAWLHLARLPFGGGFLTLATTREGRFDVMPEEALGSVFLLDRGRRVAATNIPAARTKQLVKTWLSAK